MPQNPLAANTATKSGARAPAVLNPQNAQVVGKALSASYNKSASAAIKASAGTLVNVVVLTAGSAPGAVHNCATTGTAAAGNLIFNVPNTVGIYTLEWPCDTGITYIVGTGQVVAISYV